MNDSFVTFSVQKQTRRKEGPARAGMVCLQCHGRKVRCDVQQRGVPCSNCVDHSTTCFVRQRINARGTLDSIVVGQFPNLFDEEQTISEPQAQSPKSRLSQEGQDSISPAEVSQALSAHSEYHGSGQGSQHWNAQAGDEWRKNAPNGDMASESFWNALSGVDLSNLSGLEHSYAPTEWALTSPIPPASGQPSNVSAIRNVPLKSPEPLSALPVSNSGLSDVGIALASRQVTSKSTEEVQDRYEHHASGLATSACLNESERHFLQSQGCFQLPPTFILRQMLHYYFKFVHPNLPIVDEQQFASLWTQDDLDLGGFSFVLFRAMLFTIVHFLDAGSHAMLGYLGKREARHAYYRLTKLMFDFNLETDPLVSAQVCLHLTYYVKPSNIQRLNAYWLFNATRWARAAGADRFYLVNDASRAKELKRTWWGVLFRDRILSLAQRWRPQVELHPSLEKAEHHLTAEDFSSDLGKSVVHDRAAQRQIADILASTCRLVCRVTPALHLLYDHENATDWICAVANCVPKVMSEIQCCLQNLQQWYHETAQILPEPITMDDTDESVCIFANLMFCYYSSAVFALNFHRFIINETISECMDGTTMDASLEASVAAINDLSRRTQELVQTRMTQYLPITVTVYMALPLLLQAINVAAVSGTHLETGEARKLDVFSRVLKSQEENFDGARFIREATSSIITSARTDKRFIDWIAGWRDDRERDGHGTNMAAVKGHRKAKLDWTNLISTRPKLYLHLLLQFDFAICNSRMPRSEESTLFSLGVNGSESRNPAV